MSCASVSRQIYDIVIQLVHERLRRAASLPDHNLILECYHPSDKLYTPWLSCNVAGTTTRNNALSPDPPERLIDVQQLYTTFKIEPSDKQRAERARSVRRQTGTRSAACEATAWIYDLPRQDVDIEENVLFFQLCTLTHIVKPGPQPGQFLSHTNVSDGIVRVWRDWLARHEQVIKMVNRRSGVFEGDVPDDRILWADADENVGLRCRVALYPNPYMPLIPPPDYQGSVSYHVYFEGASKELSPRSGPVCAV